MFGVCLSVCQQLCVQTTEHISQKFYNRFICGHGRTNSILKVIRIQIREFFLKDSSTLQNRAFFHSLAYILYGETDRMFVKFYHRCICGQKSPR